MKPIPQLALFSNQRWILLVAGRNSHFDQTSIIDNAKQLENWFKGIERLDWSSFRTDCWATCAIKIAVLTNQRSATALFFAYFFASWNFPYIPQFTVMYRILWNITLLNFPRMYKNSQSTNNWPSNNIHCLSIFLHMTSILCNIAVSKFPINAEESTILLTIDLVNIIRTT